MTRLMITSDLHLGHKNIHKFRNDFACADDHHEFMFEQLACNVQSEIHYSSLATLHLINIGLTESKRSSALRKL